ncbi:hypothetical protein FACS1894187_06300 [Synergistales bacterium]|nr:hypothetical protein FACS1894187_06300 [Synergistales bacterium]
MKYAWAGLVIAAIIGASVFCGVMMATLGVDGSEEVTKTDAAVHAPRDTVADIRAIMDAQDAQVKTEIRYIDREVRKNVQALPDDDLARFINDELSLWRGGDPRPARVASADRRLLYGPLGGRGSGNRVTRAPVENVDVRGGSPRP